MTVALRQAAPLALALALGCTPEAQATCDTFVDGWTRYLERCGVYADGAPVLTTPEWTRAQVEAQLFGEEGCASAKLEDFRDARTLREDCVPMLPDLACEATVLPEPCRDQIRRPDER